MTMTSKAMCDHMTVLYSEVLTNKLNFEKMLQMKLFKNQDVLSEFTVSDNIFILNAQEQLDGNINMLRTFIINEHEVSSYKNEHIMKLYDAAKLTASTALKNLQSIKETYYKHGLSIGSLAVMLIVAAGVDYVKCDSSQENMH